MDMRPRERKFWAPHLTAYSFDGTTATDPQPAVTAWEMSLDGVTWKASRAHPDDATVPCWIIDGPDFPGPGDSTNGIEPDFAPASGYHEAIVRLRDTPETLEVASLRITVR